MITSILMTAGSVSLMIVGGLGTTAMFKWLHTYEFRLNRDRDREDIRPRGGARHDTSESVSKRLGFKNSL